MAKTLHASRGCDKTKGLAVAAFLGESPLFPGRIGCCGCGVTFSPDFRAARTASAVDNQADPLFDGGLANAALPLFFVRRGVRLHSLPLTKGEGAERREGASFYFTPVRQACEARRGRRARILRCVRLPALHRGICRRPLQGSFRHQPRAALLEPAFAPANAASSSQSARSGARAESRGRPSARGTYPRPQGPHLAPPSRRLMMTPSMSEAKELNHRYIVLSIVILKRQ